MIKLTECDWKSEKYSTFLEDYCNRVLEILNEDSTSSKLPHINESYICDKIQYTFDKVGIKKEGNIQEWLTLSSKELRQIKEFLLGCNFFYGWQNKNFKFVSEFYKKLVDTEKANYFFGKKFNTEFVNILKISICPLCNRNYVNNREHVKGRLKASAQLDHCYAKSLYPIFALCLNNLIPVCQACNHIKSQNDFEIMPYDERVNEVKVWLDPENNEVFRISSANLELESQIRVLGLNKGYECHIKDVEDLILRQQIYTESKIDEINSLLGETNRSVSYKELIFGKYIPSEEDKNNSLSKLRRDVLEQLSIYEPRINK